VIVDLRHDEQRLALEQLRDGDGVPLLLIHELGGTRGDWDPAALDWEGPLWAIDLAGHGDSDWLISSAYSPERFTADCDIALAHLDEPTALAGAGAGAYVALLLAGARSDSVLGAALFPGAGLHAGGEQLEGTTGVLPLPERGDPTNDRCDPRLCVLAGAPRPVDYATSFARRARRIVLVPPETAAPAWWTAVRGAGPSVHEADAHSALRALRG